MSWEWARIPSHFICLAQRSIERSSHLLSPLRSLNSTVSSILRSQSALDRHWSLDSRPSWHMLRKRSSIAFSHVIVSALVLLAEHSRLLLSSHNMSWQLSFILGLMLLLNIAPCLYHSLIIFVVFIVFSKVKSITSSHQILLAWLLVVLSLSVRLVVLLKLKAIVFIFKVVFNFY